MQNDKMTIEETRVSVSELARGYEDNGDDGGVVAYGGKLNVRPPYQREFVYDPPQRDAVIHTALQNRPLNVMYWEVTDDAELPYAIIDGQQRTISLCEFVDGNFSVTFNKVEYYYHDLPKEMKARFDAYELLVFKCVGEEQEMLKWFETVNWAGEKLNKQELRNAVYHGSFIATAKKFFSRRGCGAVRLAKDYVNGSPERQDYLQTALRWRADETVDLFMSANRNNPDAPAELEQHFRDVIAWVKNIFGDKARKEMRGVDWGALYKKHKCDDISAAKIQARVTELMGDDEIQTKRGIYAYVLDGDERHLKLRAFPDGMKREVLEAQHGVCPNPDNNANCEGEIDLDNSEGDHIKTWRDGGKTVKENCRMLCAPCHRQLIRK